MDDFAGLTYNEIRSKCKSYGLRASGKKVDLITRLTTYLSQLGLGSDNQNNVAVTEKSRGYEVFVTDDEDEVNLRENLKLRNGRKLGCEDSSNALKETHSINIDGKVKENVTPPHKLNAVDGVNNRIKHSSSETANFMSCDEGEYQKIDEKKVTNKKKGGRFTRQHKSIFEKAESIAERQERIKELHAKHEASVPDTFKRLATPKRVSSPGRQFLFPNGEKNGYDFSQAPMDTSKLSHSLNRTPAPNFNVPKVLSGKNTLGAFQGRKKEMSLVERLSQSYKKANTAFSSNLNRDKKQSGISNKTSRGPLLGSKNEGAGKLDKYASVRSNAAIKRERKLNSCRK
uniref:SAP domain-containing protein n=1 Tax=Strongyloides venezuelensis TaxID=75913 RepID=A0A0K0FA60_STRVS